MPRGWWYAVSVLWQHVWNHGTVPRIWRYAKVTLIRKRGGPKTRPLTLTQIIWRIWRIGAKFIARALRQWAPEWASASDHGGLPGRSITDVLFQLQAAMRHGVHTAVLTDVAGYFDSMNIPAMRKVFQRLGAPAQLMPLLESFYDDAHRYFNFEGSFDPGCHVVRSGFGQGCPLSPIAAAALSHCWSEYVRSACPTIGTQIFMDDRTLWVEPSTDVVAKARIVNPWRSQRFLTKVPGEESLLTAMLWRFQVSPEVLGTRAGPQKVGTTRQGFTAKTLATILLEFRRSGSVKEPSSAPRQKGSSARISAHSCMKCSSVALELNPEPNRWGLKVEANSKVVVITAVELSHKSLTPKEVTTSIKKSSSQP